ncbi:MAG: transcription-repair coupling factor [Oscillospiraceae bacterium]|nr:transcription-repair coupling factor [Oscillospiraceae bacterium]
MNLLSTALRGLPEYRSLLRQLDNAGACAVTGLSSIHRAHMIAALREDTGRPVLVVCQDDLAAARTAEELSGFLGEKPPVFPTRELTLLGAASVSRGWEHSRLGILHRLTGGGIPVLVTSIEAMSLYTMPRSVLVASSLPLAVGGSYDLDELTARLIALGYRRSTLVEGTGQFAQRGGILDLYSPGAPAPVRVEFFGDEVDSMGFFDTASQRRTENTEEILVLPTAEVLPGLHPGGTEGLVRDLESMLSRQKRRKHPNEALMETLRQDMELLSSGASFPAADRYGRLIYPSSETLTDYLSPETVVVFADRIAIERQQKQQQEELGQSLDSLLGNGTLAGELCDFYETLDGCCGALDGNNVIYMDNFLSSAYPESLPPQELLNVTVKQLPSYGGSLDTAVGDMQHYASIGFGTLVLCGTRHRGELLLESMEARGVKGRLAFPLTALPRPGEILLTEGSLAAGMEYPSLKLAILTEGQITAQVQRPRRKRRKTATNRQKLSSFTDLSPGDLVVHDAHGIGRFVRVEQMKLDGVVKDYIKIAYQGTDVLYVPATQLDMVSKYIGAGEDAPVKLNRLGGDSWEKSKRKAKAAAKDLAEGLIKLYAERKRLPGYAFSPDSPWQQEFEDSFPYAETDDQLRCIDEIKADMEASTPMDRLLCGDVGFGKTEVALRAAMKCILDGKQCAILVPTTVLAQQHYVTALGRFASFPVNIDVLSRFRTAAQQKRTLHAMETGTVDLVVGTHKLLQKGVTFKNLGLLIVDEEQRFGVTHKERLKEISQGVDVLTLSATPIPRTLNMALSGLRDMSTIEEPPGDRYPVQTYVIEHDYDVLADAIRREVARGGQVYYLHNRVDSIHLTAARLRQRLPDVAIGVGHGKMHEDELSDVMQQMSDGEIQVLVCTTIIETGIDIPNVNTLIIEDADKLGLAQLHQLRGRVGRSNRHAYAYLTFRKGKVLSETAEKRMSAIREFAEFGSGFKIAMRDLEIRGAGNLLGAEQSGHMVSVGYDMYLRLLEEAIIEQKGETPPEDISCSADINISANIPEDYVLTGEGRMELYRRIAAIRTESDADDVMDEIIDRYGEPPKPVIALLSVALLRSRATTVGIREITQKGSELYFSFRDLEPAAVSGIFGDPFLKQRVLFSPKDPSKITLKLRGEEDPLRLSETFVRKLQAFSAAAHP